MTVLLRGRWYHYQKVIGKVKYRRALNVPKGQEGRLKARIEQVEDEIFAGHFNVPAERRRPIRLSEFVPIYLERKASKRSIDRDGQRLPVIQAVIGDRFLSAYGPTHFQRLEAALLDRKLTPATVNRYFQLLRALFSLAVEEGYLASNPLRFYRFYVEDSQTRALSIDELRQILAALREVKKHSAGGVQAILYDVAVVGLSTGMRLSEIINLRWSWIGDGVASIPITATKHRRRVVSQKAKAKLVVLPPAAQAAIGRFKGASKDDFVFPMKRRDPRSISKAIIQLRPKLGVPDFHFHQLRHTFSTALSASSDLATASAALGHQDIKTTMRYSHPGLKHRQEVVTKMVTNIFGPAFK